MTVTVAFSQELLAPPDANTAAGAWTQRFADGTQVLTATGFGTWGAGFVEAVNGPNIQQTGHGYITGNTWHAAGASGSGAWLITVLDADHFSLTTEVSNSGAVSYTHLDVYKRQPLPALRWGGTAMASNCRLRNAVSVSYTHLDVYKRQALMMDAVWA